MVYKYRISLDSAYNYYVYSEAKESMHKVIENYPRTQALPHVHAIIDDLCTAYSYRYKGHQLLLVHVGGPGYEANQEPQHPRL